MAAPHTPPHDLDAETALLGAMLLTRDATTTAEHEGVTATDLYAPRHADLYEAITKTIDAGELPDPVAVAPRLPGDTTANVRWLREVQAATPASANAAAYARRVHTLAVRRRVLATAADLERTVRAGEDPTAILEHAIDLTRHTNGQRRITPVDLGAVLRGDPPEHAPTMLARNDGKPLLYPGLITGIHGEPSHGKTWVALLACAEQMHADHHVVYVDGESDRDGMVERLRALGLDDPTIETHFVYLEIDGALELADLADIRAIAAELAAAVVVYDTVTTFLQRAGHKENDPEVLRWLDPACRPPARDGAAVIPLDHVTKDRETRGRWARGSGAKLGLYDAAYSLEATRPFSKEQGGNMTLTIAKDRYGAIGRQGETVAHIHVEPKAGLLVADITAGHPTVDAWHGPTQCMDAIIALLEQLAPTELSTNQLEARLRDVGKSYRKTTISAAASQAVTERRLAMRAGRNKSFLYRATTPTLSDDDEPF